MNNLSRLRKPFLRSHCNCPSFLKTSLLSDVFAPLIQCTSMCLFFWRLLNVTLLLPIYHFYLVSSNSSSKYFPVYQIQSTLRFMRPHESKYVYLSLWLYFVFMVLMNNCIPLPQPLQLEWRPLLCLFWVIIIFIASSPGPGQMWMINKYLTSKWITFMKT